MRGIRKNSQLQAKNSTSVGFLCLCVGLVWFGVVRCGVCVWPVICVGGFTGARSSSSAGDRRCKGL